MATGGSSLPPLLRTLQQVIRGLPAEVLVFLLERLSKSPLPLVAPLNQGSWDDYAPAVLKENLVKSVNGYFVGPEKSADKVAKFCGALVDIEQAIKEDHEKQEREREREREQTNQGKTPQTDPSPQTSNESAEHSDGVEEDEEDSDLEII
ncbi:hypothetical protein TrRE_jg9640 [Triparma retinervis]|uniref:Uncharacterized protein n=1 Tax=Triparma retinervis TaxID=2557542 RepID=A0A9W7F657_9STRA|nr:hypothetical protein TrRE_jg9640 [Triparma retinervis]